MQQHYSYRKHGTKDISIWDSGKGGTISGPHSSVLSDVKDEFCLTPLEPVARVSQAFADLRLWDSSENTPGRLVVPYKEAHSHPAVIGFLNELQAALPGSTVRNCRLQLFTTSDAYQGLHKDGWSNYTAAARIVYTITTAGLTKLFTLRDTRKGESVTLKLPTGTLMIGSRVFFGVGHHYYLHGVEANPDLGENDYIASLVADLAGVTISDCRQGLPVAARSPQPGSVLDKTALIRTGEKWSPWRGNPGEAGRIANMRDLERLGTTAYREQFVEMGQKGGSAGSEKQAAQREKAGAALAQYNSNSKNTARSRQAAGSRLMKVCPGCKENKSTEEFGTSSSRGKLYLRAQCRACFSNAQRAYRKGKKQRNRTALQDIINISSDDETEERSVAKRKKGAIGK